MNQTLAQENAALRQQVADLQMRLVDTVCARQQGAVRIAKAFPGYTVGYCRLLWVLRHGQILGREEILFQVGKDYLTDLRNVDQMVKRARKKGAFIKAYYGLGYQLLDPTLTLVRKALA